MKTAYNADSAKLFKLLQQCQERALTIISTEGNKNVAKSLLDYSNLCVYEILLSHAIRMYHIV